VGDDAGVPVVGRSLPVSNCRWKQDPARAGRVLGVRRSGCPSRQLSPVVGNQRFPREWLLGVDVAVAIVSVSLGKLDLQRGIALGPLRVRTDEITRQQASCSLKLPARRTWMWVRWLPGGSRKYRFVRSVLSARKT
jgi:hypothetical protein